MSEITERLTAAIADRYVIERELGAGGMATVYLAHDVKHDRKVALKVLRPELAAVIGAERFLQEIKVTANLQHSHILPLYDSGAAEGFLFYVMPYVEGETLRIKLNKDKQLGVDEAVALTRAIAGALEHAHKQGVIHRDIKPENILLREGDPLIADFGIALAVSHAGGNRLTETGLSIGTPHYMSPEQAMGDRELDARSDVYSLGAVLYEMLTGDPPYQGSTAQAIVAKVITEKAPPVTAIRDTVPEHVGAAIGRALAKLPADRFHSAAEFAEALARPGLALPTTAVVPAAQPASRDRRLVVLAAVAAAAVGLGSWGWLRQGPSVPAPGPVRFTLGTEAARIDMTQGNRLLDVSPDGSLIAYVGTDSAGGHRLFLRRAGALGVTPIEGTEGALQPFFSPDGEWLGFVQEADIKKVRVAGGPPLTVARGANAWGVHWGANDTLIFRAESAPSGIAVVPAAGGNPQLIREDLAGVQLRWPELLPGGRAALVTVFPSLSESQIAVLDLETGAMDTVITQGTHPHYLPTGHIAYGHPAGGVFAVPFDAAARRVTGDPVPVLEDVVVFSGGATQFAASAGGTAAYAGGRRAQDELVTVDLDGRVTPIPGDQGDIDDPRFSPDGGRIAFVRQDAAARDVYVLDLALGTRSRITFGGTNRYPSWSPDGVWLIFGGEREGTTGSGGYRRRADGGGREESLLSEEGEYWVQEQLADGTLIYRDNTGERGRDILIRLPADSAPRPLLTNDWDEVAPRVSPDGRWVAYSSNETNTFEVYVTSFPEAAGRWQVSQGGGTEPVWSPDGSGIYYWAADALMQATVRATDAFAIVDRREVLRGLYGRFVLFAQYDVHPSGRQFVMVRNQADDGTPVVVVANWFTELRERTGGDRP